MTDLIKHPKHYTSHPSGVECIDIVQHFPFNIGTAMKHLWRAGLKEGSPALVDLQKAKQYIEFEIKRVEENNRVKTPWTTISSELPASNSEKPPEHRVPLPEQRQVLGDWS